MFGAWGAAFSGLEDYTAFWGLLLHDLSFPITSYHSLLPTEQNERLSIDSPTIGLWVVIYKG